MASGFWYLEDGRGFSRRFIWMAEMMTLIVDELFLMPEAKDFAYYMNQYVMKENDEPNGYGGFYNTKTDESIMMDFDLRSFTEQNRMLFWKAAQNVNNKLHQNKVENEGTIYLFSVLLDMHKRVERNENPMELNHLVIIEPHDGSQLGPGWNNI